MKFDKKNIILITLMVSTIIVFCIFMYTFIKYILVERDLQESLGDNNYTNDYVVEEGNNTVITVDEDSSIRIITEYNENMFKGHKSILFFWASWCSHCQEEFDVIKTAISDYQNRGYNIYIISHDYEKDTLYQFMKNNDLNYEVYFDETRIIRKNLDPNASSVPLTYILNEEGRLIDSHGGPITLEKLNELMNKNM